MIGTDATYAPNEFTEGKKIVGSEIDLFNPVAAKFGVTAEWQTAKFATIIPGVTSGKYDMGVSSFTINDRAQEAGHDGQLLLRRHPVGHAAGNPKGVDPNNPCGKTIAVQNNTTQQQDDLPARQKKCGSNKINILPYDGQDAATAAVATGKADAMLADSPVTAYAVKQSGGKLAAAGRHLRHRTVRCGAAEGRARLRPGGRRCAQVAEEGRQLQGRAAGGAPRAAPSTRSKSTHDRDG